MPLSLFKTILLSLPRLLTGRCKNYLVEKLAFLPEKASHYPPVELTGVEELWIQTGDKLKIHSFLLKHPDSGRIILFFHGNAGNAYSRLPHAQLLRNMGFNVLLIDYHGYGKSEGTPSEQAFYLDAHAAYDTALNKLGFAPNKISIYGRSIGSAAALELASRYEIGALILVAPFASGRSMALQLGFGWLNWLVKGVFNNLDKARCVDEPVLIIHGAKDSIIPADQSRDLLAAIAAQDKQRVVMKEAGHNDIGANGDEAFWLLIENFLNRQAQAGN